MAEAILIYDGNCEFCTRCAHFVEARWAPRTARIVPSQDLDDAALETFGLTRAQVDAAAWWITDDEVVGAERAVAGALSRCGPPWRLMGWLITVPVLHGVARLVYRVVVRNRHRLHWPRPSARN